MAERYGIFIILKENNKKRVTTFIETKKRPSDKTLKLVGNDIKDSLHREHCIIVDCQTFNSISNTWMTLSSYYVNEDKIVHL